MWYWITLLIITLGLIFVFFWINNFSRQFKSQGKPASKLSEKEIEQWKNCGLSGKEAGKAYNNGWTNPENPYISQGKISAYSNYSQTDRNLNPTVVSKFELDKYYQLGMFV